MAAHAAQAVQVSLLQGLLHWIAVILLVPRGLRLGCGDEQLFSCHSANQASHCV